MNTKRIGGSTDAMPRRRDYTSFVEYLEWGGVRVVRLVLWCCGYIVDVLDEGNFLMLGEASNRGCDGPMSQRG
jgi:hypothetical protein